MIVRFKGNSDPMRLLNGKEYRVESIECGWYRIVDETHEDYLYPARCFEIMKPDPAPPVVVPAKAPA